VQSEGILIHKIVTSPLEKTLSVTELMKCGISKEEALDQVNSTPSFPYVLQEEWPSKREHGKEGGHFNLIQLPFDVEVDEYDFALDYQVAIFFEIGEKYITRDEIFELTKERLKIMNIEVGQVLDEPIAIMCFHGSRKWSGTIKLHLKHPEINGYGLLRGLRPFILKLDNLTYYRGKVSKSFDSIAIASLLSVKVTSIILKGKHCLLYLRKL